MRQIYRHRPPPGHPADATVARFCAVFNDSTPRRANSLSMSRFSTLLDATQLKALWLWQAQTRFKGYVFANETIIVRASLDRAVKAALRRLGARVVSDTIPKPLLCPVGFLGITGVIQDRRQRLPVRPSWVALAYSHGVWFLCLMIGDIMTAYRLRRLTLSYQTKEFGITV